MRRMRFIIFAIAVCLVALTAIAAPPPATPEVRDRINLRTVSKVEGTLRTHAEAVDLAALDSRILEKGMTKEELYYIRYLDLHNIPLSQRKAYYGVISTILNGFIKHRSVIIQPSWGGPENMMIRVNLFDYGISTQVWDTLAKQDPYFHQFILQQDVITKDVQTGELEWYKTGLYYGGDVNKPEWKQRYKSNQEVEVTKPIKKQVLAAWLNKATAGELGVRLQTAYPILRGDWFITNVTLEPHYSNFLGIKTLDELKKFGGFDERADITEIKSTIVSSGSDGLCQRVSRNNRILARRNTIWGDWWETYDFKTSISEQNVINNYIKFLKDPAPQGKKKMWRPTRDAAEYIVRSPSGLQWYMITDGNDKAVAAGDINIVVDSMAIDSQVRNGRSCIWCHAQGINPFKSVFQRQVGWKPNQSDLGFYDKDPKKALIIRQQVMDTFGLPNFDTIVSEDSERYNKAVKAASDMTAVEFASAFTQAWNGYFEDLVTVEKACYELGLTEQELQMILGLRFEGRNNGVLIQALEKPPVAIRRDQWEESFFEAALLSTLKGKFKLVPVAPPAK